MSPQAIPKRKQRIETLIPTLYRRALSRALTDAAATRAIAAHPGLLPVALDGERVLWADVGEHRFTEWKFRDSVAAATGDDPNTLCFSTSWRHLASLDAASLGQEPRGFIFHMSCCGSTLLTKVLARSPDSGVICEPSPLHERLWGPLTRGWQRADGLDDEGQRMVANLLRLLGRRRWAGQAHSFVKFRSWNVLFVHLIAKIFPGVPRLFVYRSPEEVLVSAMTNEPFGYTRMRSTPAAPLLLDAPAEVLAGMDLMGWCARLYRAYLRAALADEGLILVDYRRLSAEHLPVILRDGFGLTPSPAHLAEMVDEFSYYSKEDQRRQRFRSDQVRKQRLVTPEIRAAVDREGLGVLVEQLRRSGRSL